MVNRLLHLVIVLFALDFAGRAMAHGENPSVLSIAATRDGAAEVLRLNEGLAVLHDDGYRYLCPALWGDDDMGQAVSMPGGPVVIASVDGLHVLGRPTGEVVPHPERAVAAAGLALRATSDGVLQLVRDGTGRASVLRVGASSSEEVFAEDVPWEAMGASDELIVLARLVGAEIEQLRLAPDGRELERTRAVVVPEAVAVRPRAVGSEAYLLLITDGGLASQLGRMDADGFQVLQQGGGVISGPVVVGDARWTAVEGALTRLGEEPDRAGEGPIVTCVGEHAGAAYACADTGLRTLETGGHGEVLFDLSELLPPAASQVPESVSELCELQWARYRLDLIMAGIEPREAPVAAPLPDAGSADADDTDAGVTSASVGARDAGEAPVQGDAGSAAGADSGCSVGGDPVGVAGLSVVALWVLRRRRWSTPAAARRGRARAAD